MFESHRIQFAGLVTTAANRLQQDLIRLTESNHLEVSSVERTGFEAPPLRPPSPYIDGLENLPSLLYGSDPSRDAIFSAWDTLTTSLVSGVKTKQATDAVADVFPCMPCKGFRLVDVVIRFLYAAGWNKAQTGIKVFASPHQIVLESGRLAIGLVDNNVLLGTTRRRIRRMPPVDLASALRCPLGSPRSAGAKASGLYRRLALAMPEHSEVIHSVFSSVVHAGREFENILTDPFDINLIRMSDPNTDAWADARKLIQDAKVNPVDKLHLVLRGHVNYETFRKTFGNPYRTSSGYTRKTRTKHLDAITQLELAESPDSCGAGAIRLLELQRAISNIHV